jgi:CheY-like chemotaxis protein
VDSPGPVSRKESSEIPRAAGPREIDMKILIAEDNLVMAHVLQFNLERAGFEVHAAADGALALEAAMEDTFDVVITDYQMPRMNGEELVRQLRTYPEYMDTPMVLCSAKGYEIDTAQLERDLGIAEVVYKPFSPAHIVELITALTATLAVSSV